MLLTKILYNNVKSFPNKPAFTMKIGFRTKTFTYLQVYELAKKTAVFIRKNGLNKGDKVLIFAHNSPYWGIIFWATILSGVVLVPINVQSTPDIIDKILKQTDSKLVFKSRYLRTDFELNYKNFDIEYLEDYIKDIQESDFICSDLNENDIIEILYTSGTTGDPKGVLLTHKNIYSNLNAVSKIISLNKLQERILSILPLTHIFEQTMGFFLPQEFTGHIIYAHSYAVILDLMKKYKITKILAVPEFLKVFLSRIKLAYSQKGLLWLFVLLKKISSFFSNTYIAKLLFFHLHMKFGGKLGLIACGGAFLEPDLEKEWNALGFVILQGYGLTETSPLISCNPYHRRKIGSVGKIVHNINVKIEDGQILVKGPGVFLGYFNNKEKTKEVFTEDGYFKTGDIGYIDKDRYLFLKGRKKYVILGFGGQNVFPEDIEIELNKAKGIKDSCVLGVPKKGGNVQIHAVLLLDNKNIDVSKIIELINKKLASYQRINDFTLWKQDDFPRSSTHKIKKDIVFTEITSKEKSKVVHNGRSTSLVYILSQMTGIPAEDINKDKKIVSQLQFDSLLKIELIIRIEDKFGISIDESLITSDTTVDQLQSMINKNEQILVKSKLKEWPRSFWAAISRAIGQFNLILFSKIFFRLNVQGFDYIKDLKEPVLFMPNHNSYSDPLVIIMALPYKIRKRLCFAAAKDVLYEEYKYVAWLADLFFNSFPFPRTNGENIFSGLEHIGELLDEGYSVVVFPEGKMSRDGKLLPLKSGAGLMAIEMQCPIVPIKIEGSSKIVPYCKILPRKIGKVKVKIGKPIKFNLKKSYEFVTKNIEEALKNL